MRLNPKSGFSGQHLTSVDKFLNFLKFKNNSPEQSFKKCRFANWRNFYSTKLYQSDLQLQPKNSLNCPFYSKLSQFLQFWRFVPSLTPFENKLLNQGRWGMVFVVVGVKLFWFKDFEVIGSRKMLSDLSVKVFNIFAHSRFRRSQKTVKLVWWPFTSWKTGKIRWLCPGLTASYWQLGEFQTQTPLE